ncbi:MAG: tetratricopeptide repeat protein [Nitrospinales bacterium]
MKMKTSVFSILCLLLVLPTLSSQANDTTIETYQKAVIENPDDASAHYKLGLAYQQLGQYPEAIRELQEVLRLAPDHAKAKIALGKTYVLLGRGEEKYPRRFRPEEAVVKYKKIVTENPNDAEAHRLLGNAYLELGKYYQAIEAYKKALRINPEDAETYLYLGIGYYKIDWFAEAIAELQQALSLNINGSAHIYLGLIYRAMDADPKPVKEGLRISVKGDYAEDEKRAVLKNPNDPDAHHTLGNSYLVLGWYPKAIKQYQEVLRLDPNKDVVHYRLGIVYKKLAQYQKAIKEFEYALKAHPKDAWANYNIGQSYAALDRHQDAISAFEKALAIKPKDPNIHISLGLAYKRYAMRVHPDIPDDNIALGKIFLDLRRYSEAVTEFETALQFDPKNSDTHYQLALAYRGAQHEGGSQTSNRSKRLSQAQGYDKPVKEARNKEKALLEFHKSLRLAPDTALTHTQLGKTYLSMNRDSEAIEEFKEVIRIKPNDANSYFTLGHAYKVLNRYREAIKFLRKAIKLDPKFSDAHFSLGEIYRVTGQPDQSNAAFEAAYSALREKERSSVIVGEFEIIR